VNVTLAVNVFASASWSSANRPKSKSSHFAASIGTTSAVTKVTNPAGITFRGMGRGVR